jgi:hypothetical protein
MIKFVGSRDFECSVTTWLGKQLFPYSGHTSSLVSGGKVKDNSFLTYKFLISLGNSYACIQPTPSTTSILLKVHLNIFLKNKFLENFTGQNTEGGNSMNTTSANRNTCARK